MSSHPLHRPHNRFAALLCAAAVAWPSLAVAQNAVTLYGGFRSGSGFEQSQPPNNAVDMRSTAAASVGIEWPYDAGRPFQLLLSYQRTKLELGSPATGGAPSELPLQVAYVHFGGLNYFEGTIGGRGPYVAGGLGATFMNPD
ncbi:MAG TPA: hypothetical protein VFK10_07065, partial [Burkholderiaceae bacterium]|nr:hypothetical protein [Burkholderiaceae bacterium]